MAKQVPKARAERQEIAVVLIAILHYPERGEGSRRCVNIAFQMSASILSANVESNPFIGILCSHTIAQQTTI